MESEGLSAALFRRPEHTGGYAGECVEDWPGVGRKGIGGWVGGQEPGCQARRKARAGQGRVCGSTRLSRRPSVRRIGDEEGVAPLLVASAAPSEPSVALPPLGVITVVEVAPRPLPLELAGSPGTPDDPHLAPSRDIPTRVRICGWCGHREPENERRQGGDGSRRSGRTVIGPGDRRSHDRAGQGLWGCPTTQRAQILRGPTSSDHRRVAPRLFLK